MWPFSGGRLLRRFEKKESMMNLGLTPSKLVLRPILALNSWNVLCPLMVLIALQGDHEIRTWKKNRIKASLAPQASHKPPKAVQVVCKSPKMSYFLNVSILALSTLFCLPNVTCLITLFGRELQLFLNLPNWPLMAFLMTFVHSKCKLSSLRSQS